MRSARCPRCGRFAGVSFEPSARGQHRPGFLRLWHGARSCWLRLVGPPTPARLFPHPIA